MDAGNREIVASVLTDDGAHDAGEVPTLLQQVSGEIVSVTADGAYNGEPVYRAIASHRPGPPPDVVIPPRSSAVAADRARARAVFPGVTVRFLPGDITALPFADASLDAAMSLAVFWMVPEPGHALADGHALAEAARVLRPEGRLAFTDCNRTSSPPGLLPAVADHRPLLEAAGFRVLDFAEVAGAEARRRRVYALYLDRQEALRREMGPEVAATLAREANRALGRLEGVDHHLANSRLVLVVAERCPD